MKIFLYFSLILFSFRCAMENQIKYNVVKRYTLRNLSSPLEVVFHPNAGNFISQIYLHGQEVLYSPHFESTLQVGEKLEGIPFLFPYANRLEEDKIPTQNGYHEIPKLPFMRDGFGKLIHGFMYYRKGWVLETLRNGELDSYSESKFQFGKEELEWFPFPLEITYKIELERNEIRFIIQIFNQGEEPIPLSLGFHPYFYVPLEEKPKISLSTNAKKFYETSSNLLPTGKLFPIKELLKNKTLSEIELDHNFTEFPKNEIPHVKLSTKNYTLRVELLEGFDHLLIYNPSGKEFVCIEPMFGPTNAFYLYPKIWKKPIPSLARGKTWTGKWRLIFEN